MVDQLLDNNKYIVRSNVRSEIFQSFEKEIPDIQLSNFNEFELLSQEFEMMTGIIAKTKNLPLFKIESLINNSCSDKLSIENDISKQLDFSPNAVKLSFRNNLRGRIEFDRVN